MRRWCRPQLPPAHVRRPSNAGSTLRLAQDPPWPPSALSLGDLIDYPQSHDRHRPSLDPEPPPQVFRVLDLRVEGVSIAAIARLEGISWSTAARWLEHAAAVAAAFQETIIWDVDLLEVQADEMRTFVPGKRRPLWIYTTMEVSSRLWPVLRVGRRGHRATMRVMLEVAGRGHPGASPLVATDGYRDYKHAVRVAFGRGCAVGQVHQDAKARPRRPGRVAHPTVHATCVAGSDPGVGRLHHPEYLVHRAPELDGAGGVGVSGATHCGACQVYAAAARSPRAVPMLLQLHEAALGAALRPGGADAGAASRAGLAPARLGGHPGAEDRRGSSYPHSQAGF